MRVIAGDPDEIVLPETKPETEWILGRAVRKVSPKRKHGRLQARLAGRLDLWSPPHGEVATEWRVRLAPRGEVRRPLVPDVSFVSRTALRGVALEDREVPDFAPTVAFEIRSPGDRVADIEEKIRVYLECGARAVVIVDGVRRSLRILDEDGDRTIAGDATFEHPALPGFRLALGDLFSVLDPSPEY